jgi:hypothetical protein
MKTSSLAHIASWTISPKKAPCRVGPIDTYMKPLTDNGHHNVVLIFALGSCDGHFAVKSAGYRSGMSYDPSTIAMLRRALDEVLLEGRLFGRKSVSTLEIAEHLLAQAAAGERNLERLKTSALKKLIGNAERFPDQAA